MDPGVFASCCKIKADTGDWIPFELWQAQTEALALLHQNRLVIWLKARQLGMTWLALAYALWVLLFEDGVTVLLFSKRDNEACELLERLKDMYARLPAWLRLHGKGAGNAHRFDLGNGSRALAFPTSGGDSYTARLAIVDEADLAPDLDRMLGSIKPTIDAGGKLLLLSRPDKAKPQSPFKAIFRAASEGKGPWKGLFLPWHCRPDRTQEWYESMRQDSLTRTGSLDSCYEQYAATVEEALSAASLDKRFPLPWIEACWEKKEPVEPAITCPGLTCWELPEEGHTYVIGADTSEGIPGRDPSAACVLCRETGKEVAILHGLFEPAVYAAYLDDLGTYYSRAGILVERNNHGCGVLLWLKDNSKLRLLKGTDDKVGWLTSTLTKHAMMDLTAESLRDGLVTIRSPKTKAELADLEGATLKAPEGLHDDAAVALALALEAVILSKPTDWKGKWRL